MIKKILIITEAYPPILNSAAKLIDELACELRQTGWEVIILTETYSDNFSLNNKSYKNTYYIPKILSKRKGFILRGIRELLVPFVYGVKAKKLVKKYEIENVFIYSPPLSMGLIKLFLAQKVILNIQDIFPQYAKDLGIIKSKIIFNFYLYLQKFIIKKNDHVITQSYECKEYLRKISPESMGKIFAVNNWQAFSESKFNSSTSKKNSSNKIKIIYCGNIGPAQDIINFIFKIKTCPNIELDIYGAGSEKEKIIEKCSDLLNIKIFDELDQAQLESVFDNYDIGLVSLNVKLTTPITPGKILTYLEYGLPILAYAPVSSGLKKEIEINEIGFYVDANDSNEMALSKIHGYFKNPIQKRSSTLKTYLIEKASPSNAASKIELIFNK